MRYIILILSLLCFSSKASDSLDTKKKRFLLEVNYERSAFLLNRPIGNNNGNELPVETYTFSNINGGGLFLNYLLYQFNINSKFYVGLGANVNQMQVEHYVYNEHNDLKPGYDYHDFSVNYFSYSSTPMNLSCQLNWIINIKNFIIQQKLGVSYTTYIQKSEIQYEEHVYGQRYQTLSPPVVIEYFDFYVDRSEKNYFKDCFNGYYSLGFGYRIKQFTPMLSCEVASFNRDFHSPLVKGQLGFMFSF